MLFTYLDARLPNSPSPIHFAKYARNICELQFTHPGLSTFHNLAFGNAAKNGLFCYLRWKLATLPATQKVEVGAYLMTRLWTRVLSMSSSTPDNLRMRVLDLLDYVLPHVSMHQSISLIQFSNNPGFWWYESNDTLQNRLLTICLCWRLQNNLKRIMRVSSSSKFLIWLFESDVTPAEVQVWRVSYSWDSKTILEN